MNVFRIQPSDFDQFGNETFDICNVLHTRGFPVFVLEDADNNTLAILTIEGGVISERFVSVITDTPDK